jgi:methionyl-tRNA formyltransferase
MRVVFMGTPEFATPSLRMLADEGHEIAAVVCQPDRPRGRGGRTTACPAKVEALAMGLRVLSFERIRDPEAVAALRQLAPDVLVTAAYGQILSKKILDIPPLGCINVHGSLLPRYRGPAPIQWAIIQGERTTGVTTMLTDRGVDTGDILLQRTLEIGPEETAGELTARLAALGADALRLTLQLWAAGQLKPTPQNPAEATRFPMLTREDGRIDWRRPAGDIVNGCGAVDPWPGAFTVLAGETLKIWKFASR